MIPTTLDPETRARALLADMAERDATRLDRARIFGCILGNEVLQEGESFHEARDLLLMVHEAEGPEAAAKAPELLEEIRAVQVAEMEGFDEVAATLST